MYLNSLVHTYTHTQKKQMILDLYSSTYCNVSLAEQINTVARFSTSHSLVFIRVTSSMVSTLSKVYLLTECSSFECDILLVFTLNDEAWNWQGTESSSTCSNVPVMKAIAASWINCQCGTLPPAGSCVTAAEESLPLCSPAASAWTATPPARPKVHHHETDRETSAAAPWKEHKKISVSKKQSEFWGNDTRKSTEKRISNIYWQINVCATQYISI